MNFWVSVIVLILDKIFHDIFSIVIWMSLELIVDVVCTFNFFDLLIFFQKFLFLFIVCLSFWTLNHTRANYLLFCLKTCLLVICIILILSTKLPFVFITNLFLKILKIFCLFLDKIFLIEHLIFISKHKRAIYSIILSFTSCPAYYSF